MSNIDAQDAPKASSDSIINTTAVHDEKNWQSCHSMPCNIGFSGRAPVEVYFMPQLLLTSDTTTSKDGLLSVKEDSRVFAAQFRGRQLLAAEPYRHTPALSTNSTIVQQQGRLLEIDGAKARNSEGKVQVRAKFNAIHEWKHEFDPDVVLMNASSNNSRVRAAMEWCDVAHAVSTLHRTD
jgi:hypothetical protein